MISPPTYTECHMGSKFTCKTAALVALLTLVAPVHDALARSFLWKATGRQGVVYLVGSVHMLSKDYYPLSQALEAAFKDSDLLVEEADLGEMLSPDSQFRMLSRGCCRRANRCSGCTRRKRTRS